MSLVRIFWEQIFWPIPFVLWLPSASGSVLPFLTLISRTFSFYSLNFFLPVKTFALCLVFRGITSEKYHLFEFILGQTFQPIPFVLWFLCALIDPFPSYIHNIINPKPLELESLNFSENIHQKPCVMCHMSCVTCHVSHVTSDMWPVTCHITFFFLLFLLFFMLKIIKFFILFL